MNINFEKSNGLVPVIIQHNATLQVLILGYINKVAFNKTQEETKETYMSRR